MFGLDGISSRALQKYYYQKYGTTLRGLMEEHKISSDEFLEFVHDIDRSSLVPDHTLAEAITKLPGRKLILTNGSRKHALHTAKQLGIDHMFEDIFDIVAAELMPKPAAETYQRFFDRHAVDPARAAMFEDIAHNLAVPHARGMKTVLVTPKTGAQDHREDWEIAAATKAAHVDYVTQDLAAFLFCLGLSP
jgi:putative hydrolase of the HAD superfamily